MKVIKVLIFSFLFIFIFPIFSAERADYIKSSQFSSTESQISDNARVSLITMTPGKEIYLAFGHTAIRVYDLKNNIDTLFNFGVFDGADDPLFAFKFLKGDMAYRVCSGRFLPTAQHDQTEQNRVWYEQELNITPEQIKTLYTYLLWITEPENSYFQYDCVRKNCATLAFDAIDFCTEGKLQFDDSCLKLTDGSQITYRHLISSKLDSRPVFNFLINLTLGTNADKPLTISEASFLPEMLKEIISKSYTVDSQNNKRPFVLTDRTVLEKSPEQSNLLKSKTTNRYTTNVSGKSFNYNLLLWTIAFLSLVLTIYQTYCRKTYKVRKAIEQTIAPFDLLLFFTAGLIGSVIFYMTFFSSHYAVKLNLNFLWLFPLHLFFGFTVLRTKENRILAVYWIISILCSIVPFVLTPIWPQKMTPSMTPLMLIICSREMYQLVCTMPYPWYKIKR